MGALLRVPVRPCVVLDPGRQRRSLFGNREISGLTDPSLVWEFAAPFVRIEGKVDSINPLRLIPLAQLLGGGSLPLTER